MARQDVIDFTVDEQLIIAEQVLNTLNSAIHKDFSTDFTGYNISKARVGELSAKVMEQIKRGLMQPAKVVGRIE